MSKSVIIIGGGLGGLFSGAILAKEGFDVTVLEKNAIIGGGLQSFRRFGELFDTGMHIIGGMQKDGNIRRICEYLGIWDRLHIQDVDPENIDEIFFSEDGRTYHIAQGRKRFIESLCKDFPDQRANLESYVDALYRVAGEVDLFYLKPSSDYMQIHSDDFHMSANGFIAKYISDEHLRSVVAYMNPLYGGRGDITPAYIHSLISVLYLDGSSRFAGGSVLFAETLRDFIIENGGRVIAGDPVKTVIGEEKTITAVTTLSGLSYSADYYICAIHPCSFFPLLADQKMLPKPYRTRLNDLPNAYSAFTLNIKLKPNTFKYFNYTMYYMSRYDMMWKFGDTEQWPCGFLYLTPPEINQGEYANKLIVTAPMQWSFVKQWEDTTVGARGSEYLDWKETCTQSLLDCMEEVSPGFRDCIESVNSASPLTIRDFYGVKEGSMCGFSKDCNNLLMSQVPVVTKIQNLFLTGQNCNLHGFCGVSLTAINTCEAILGRNVIIDKINRFDDIRPYLEYEIPVAMKRIAGNEYFEKVITHIFPDHSVEEMRKTVERIESVNEFQTLIMAPAIRRIIDDTCTGFTYDGLDKIDKNKRYLFVSNHRDIMLDASFLTLPLLESGHDTPEITFGANLMQGEFVIDIGKSNKMFKVERPGGNAREFYRASEHMSDYLRTTLLQKQQSIWIAQRNGRTKDGRDRTDQAIIKMMAMSGKGNNVESVAELNIVPVAISYEWEPCDILKAVELYKTTLGPYSKKPGEDLHSILTGILQKKGRVHLAFCNQITESDIRPFDSANANSFFRSVADIIDKRICVEYRLYPNNYIAHDMRDGSQRYAGNYSYAQRTEFEKHISDVLSGINGIDESAIRKILMDIYANPVDSKEQFSDIS